MPPKRRTRRRRGTVRRKSRPRTGRRNAVTSMRSSVAPVADSYFVKLNYTETVLDVSTTSPFTHQWAMNDIFDPNVTGTGHQPMGHDQLALLYNKYKVFGCKFSIRFINETGTAAVVGWILKPNNTVSASMDVAQEKPYSQTRYLSAQSSTGDSCFLKGYCNNAKLLGLNKRQYGDDNDYSGVMSAVPTIRFPYLNIMGHGVNGVTSVTVRTIVSLTYYCKLYDRIPLTQS